MIPRRTVLKAAAAAAVVLPVGHVFGVAQTPSDEPLPIVDTHQHLWDLKRLRLPWLRGAGELNRDYLMADYLAAAEGLNVVRAVYMEVAVGEAQRLEEAESIINVCRQGQRGDGPTVAAVIGGSPGAAEFANYISRFKDSPYIKGVRESLRRGSAENDAFLKGVRLLGELGMSFDLLTGPDGLADAAAVARKCPDTRFVLDHCGNADARDFRPGADAIADGLRRRTIWEEGIARLADRPNVVCKVSGVLEVAAPDRLTAVDVAPVVNHCLDRFGPDRVLFASNWPVCNRGGSFRQWVSVLGEVVARRPKIERRKLFHDNAMRFYSLT